MMYISVKHTTLSVVVHYLLFYISQFSHALVSSLFDSEDNLVVLFRVPNKILLHTKRKSKEEVISQVTHH